MQMCALRPRWLPGPLRKREDDRVRF